MANLEELDDQLRARVGSRIRSVRRCALFVKLMLIVGGTAFAAVAHFVVENSQQLTAWHIAGIAASVLVAIGAVFLAFTEKDAADELDLAAKAVAEARSARDAAKEQERALQLKFAPQEEQRGELEDALKRGVELYNAMRTMRDATEVTIRGTCGRFDLEKTLDGMMEAAERSLTIAAGYQLDQHWTLAVYIAERDSEEDRVYLRCFAHVRSVKCGKAEARKWPEGVGAAGICYARAEEVVVADLADETRGNQYHAGPLARPHDGVRYRSLAAVPVVVDSHGRPWGAVVATSNTPGHFRADQGGIAYIDAARALASMVALLVVASSRATASADPGAEPSPVHLAAGS